jgi:Protein of unknown function (DUF1549)/Protein of unknown function (DUF1553)/Planctomycete cytochrome C
VSFQTALVRSITVPMLIVGLASHALAQGTSGSHAIVSEKPVSKSIQYNRDVRPILAENCFSCHGFDGGSREAGLRLDTREGATVQLDSGTTAIVPGDPQTSELYLRVVSEDEDTVMPPHHSKKRLNDKQKEILKSWIEEGATYQKHWAFIAPKSEPPPDAVGAQPDASAIRLMPANAIDSFVQSRLKAAGMSPSPSADRITLLRRVQLDLIGLPPTPDEIDSYLADCEHNPKTAYARLVDRLLCSPHFGERWARWWLDQARYGDSNGYSIDAPRQIWKFRDWVIEALNRDLPFDQFTIEQLAGDLLPDATDDQIVATGFHRNTQINQEGGIDQEQFRIDSVFDRVATTGTVWLGLTIGCAQCHNHKFDPIEQREYYQFFAFFNNQEEPTKTVYPPDLNVTQLKAEQTAILKRIYEHIQANEAKLKEWQAGLDAAATNALAKEVQNILKMEKRDPAKLKTLYSAGPGKSDAEFQALVSQLSEVEKQLEPKVTTLVLKELPQPRKTTVYVKGDFTRPAEEVTCGTPSALHALPRPSPDANLNRLDLAKWIVDRNNPLTSRVIVNRTWQQYFGRGLVETENDFGLQGSPPSHPELLDWLAIKLIEYRWSMKEIHRLIVMSETYQQSSVETPEHLEKDRENVLLSRQRRLRLDGEIVRDVALSASGLLCNKLLGPPVYPPIPDGVMNQGQVKREWKVSIGEDRYRRAMYTFLYRATPPPSLNVFDSPDGFNSCTRRIRSNTPLQALTLMNDAGYFEFAETLSSVIDKEGIASAFRRCTARLPEPDEIKLFEGLDSLSAARVMLNLDETVTRE